MRDTERMTLFEAAASFLRLSEPWSDAVEAMEAASGYDVSFTPTGGTSPMRCPSTISWARNVLNRSSTHSDLE